MGAWYQAVGEAKVLEDGWVDPLPSAPADTRLGVHGRVGRGTCTSEAAHGATLPCLAKIPSARPAT